MPGRVKVTHHSGKTTSVYSAWMMFSKPPLNYDLTPVVLEECKRKIRNI
jgi:hypothetical protein